MSGKPKKGEKDGEGRKRSSKKNKEVVESVADPLEDSEPGVVLNNELVQLLMSRMSLIQQFRSRRVNKQWLEIGKEIKIFELDLRNHFGHLEDDHLSHLCSKYQESHSVKVHSAPRITDKTMKHIGKLPLISIEFVNCRNLTDTCLVKIPQQTLQNITEINLGHASFGDRALKVGLLPSLTYLNLSYCDGITNRAAAHIVQYFPNLTALDISNSPVLGDDFLTTITGARKLVELNLKGCYSMSHSGLSKLAPSTSDIASNPGLLALKKLNLSATYLSNDSLLNITNYYTNLVELSFAFCHRIDDDGTQNFPKLQSLHTINMSYTGVGPTTMSYLKSLPDMKLTILAGCTRTDSMIKSFIRENRNLTIITKTTTKPPLASK